MAQKHLNLSILIGDMKRSSQSSPRVTNTVSPTTKIGNRKSRIPLATSIGVHNADKNKEFNAFRQWAEPPPAPPRSRTLERKINPLRHRTGSADPRFRRTMVVSKSISETSTLVVDQKKEVTETLSTVIPITDQKEFPENTNTDLFHLLQSDKNENLEKQLNTDKNDGGMECIKTFMFMESKEYPEYKDKKNVDKQQIFENNFNEQEQDKLDNCSSSSKTVSKISQSDVSEAGVNESVSTTKLNFEISPETILESQSLKYIDNITLSRTRSIDAFFEKRKESKSKVKKRVINAASRLLMKQPMSMFMEVWIAFVLFLLLILCAWIYLLPFVFDGFYTMFRPKPRLSVFGYFMKSLTDIATATGELFHGVLTAPSIRRFS